MTDNLYLTDYIRIKSKKEKRKKQYRKNRAHQNLFSLMRMRRAEAARIKTMEEAMKPKRNNEPKADKKWSEKTNKIRNRLTGKKRESKERWNRFAGTGDAGGRGL